MKIKNAMRMDLLLAMQTVFAKEYTPEEFKILSKEFARSEKLFGYREYSFGRSI